MEKQKEQFKKVLASLGFASEEIDTHLATFEAGEDIDTEAIQLQAQAYAKPLVKEDIIGEVLPRIKGEWINGVMKNIASISEGKISRNSLNEMPLEDAIKKLKEVSSVKGDDTQYAEVIDRLNAELAAKDTEWQGKYEALENGIKAEKFHANNRSGLSKFLSDKDITADKSVAERALYRDLQDKYHVVYNEQLNDFDLFDKEDNTKRIKKAAGTDFLKGSDEITGLIKQYGWEKKSNGSTPPPTKRTPPTPTNGGKKSAMSEKYANAGHIEE